MNSSKEIAVDNNIQKCECLFVVLRLTRRMSHCNKIICSTRYEAELKVYDSYKEAIGRDTHAAVVRVCSLAYRTLSDYEARKEYFCSRRYPEPDHNCTECLATINRARASVIREQQEMVERAKRREAAAAAARKRKRADAKQARLSTTAPHIPTAAVAGVDDGKAAEAWPSVASTHLVNVEEQQRRCRQSSKVQPPQDWARQTATSALRQQATIDKSQIVVAVDSSPKSATPEQGAPYYKRELLQIMGHKKQRARDGTSSRMIAKCLWGPHNVEASEDVEWLLEHYPRELANYVEFMCDKRPQGYRGFIGNVENILDRLQERLAKEMERH